MDARWTKKHGKSHFGYKNHINVDRRHKLIREYEASSASVHDSQKLDELIDADNTASGFWGDSAYRSADTENKLKDKGYCSHHNAKRNKLLVVLCQHLHPLAARTYGKCWNHKNH